MFEILLGSLIGLFEFIQTIDTKSQPRDTVNLSQSPTPNGLYRGPAQLGPMGRLQFCNVVRQAYDYNCGSAMLTTLLDYYLGHNPKERQVMEGLLRCGGADKIVQRRGFSLLDMKRYAAALGYKSGGFRVEFSDLGALEHPALVPIHYAGFKRSVVMRDVYNDCVFIADPALGNTSFTRARFEETWDQDVLFAILPSGQELHNALALNDRDIRLVDDCTVSLLAFHGSPQINKITENQVRELGTSSGVVHLRTKQQIPKNKNNL